MRVRRKRLYHHPAGYGRQKRKAAPQRLRVIAVHYPIKNRIVLAIDRDQMVETLRDAPRIGGGLPIELLRVQFAEERLRVSGDGFGFIEDLWECEFLIVHSNPG